MDNCNDCTHIKVCEKSKHVENYDIDECGHFNPRWINVKDHLPKKNGKYLICDKHGNINVRTYYDGQRHPFDIGPSHPHYFMAEWWAELPAPPTI